MLTYELKKSPGIPLYEALYRCIREDILSGKLPPDSRLPSKRALADHLEVSKVTVEGAYSQLVSEGYLRAQEKVGYFVEPVAQLPRMAPPKPLPQGPLPSYSVDLTSNSPGAGFPFSVWMRLQRQVMLDYGDHLLRPLPTQGYLELRQAIAAHLAAFRNMQVNPEHIIIGAGTDFLYNLLIQLLGRDKIYAVEEPGYEKIRKIYDAGGVAWIPAVIDGQGVVPESLGSAQLLHCSPSHHFPTGIVTTMPRRQQLLSWAYGADDRYIIEDDYDSEFRFHAHPMPTLQAMDRQGRVIYLNTFSKTLAPSIRISYMILPQGLLEEFRQKLGFYSCTVPSFEQYTLARFLNLGHFEKHLNRMRKVYKARRNRLITLLHQAHVAPRLTILEQDAGLHFLLRVETGLSDQALTSLCRSAGIRVQTLSEFYHGPVPPESRHCLVINYSGLQEENIPKSVARLAELLEKADPV